MLLPEQLGLALLQSGAPARRARHRRLLGRRPARQRAAIRAQVLQPLHLQLLLFCRRLPEPPLLRRLLAVEHGQRGGPGAVEGAVGERRRHGPLLLPLLRRALPRRPRGRLAISAGAGLVLLPPPGLVPYSRILRQEPRRVIKNTLNGLSERTVCQGQRS